MRDCMDVVWTWALTVSDKNVIQVIQKHMTLKVMFESFIGYVCRTVLLAHNVDTTLTSLLYSCTTDAVFSEVHDQ